MALRTPDEHSRRARDRAEQLHAAQTLIEMKFRTTAVLVAKAGTRHRRYVSSSLPSGLRLSQALLLEKNEIAVGGAPGHAEMKALAAADADRRTPVGLGVSRPICMGCRNEIGLRGGSVVWVARAIWP